MDSFVSILMPIYNGGRWIEKTIQSVIDQNYENWELIVIDDGSEDNSFKIAKSISDRDERIRVYKQENRGACATRNRCFDLSRGGYIQYLDADDILSKNKIESQLNALSKIGDKNAIANCSWEKFFNIPGDRDYEAKLIDKSYNNPLKWLTDSWLNGVHSQTNCWLVPSHLIKSSGRWNEELIINQDGDFFCRVLLKASKIVYVKNAMVYYRTGNSQSVSQSSFTKDKAYSKFRSYALYEEYLRPYWEDETVRKSLMLNYVRFLSQFDRYYPELSSRVWERIEQLGGSEYYEELIRRYGNKASKLLGFKNYLRIARLKNRYIS